MQAYPEELIVPPCPLVCLVSDAPYIDMLTVALKSATPPTGGITNHMLTMRYEPRSANYTLPVAKKQTIPKDATYYDNYIPEYMLKSNWMHKHQNNIPAVVVSNS